MHYYFQLRWQMLRRQLRDFGISPLPGIGLLAGLFLGASWFAFYRFDAAAWGYAVLPAALAVQLHTPGSIDFLQTCFPDSWRRLRGIENLLVALPFVGFLLAKGCHLPATVSGLAAIGMAFVPPVVKMHTALPTPFSRRPFEFSAGFRRTWPVLVLALVLMAIAARVSNFNLSAFALMILFLVALSFYQFAEPVMFVWMDNRNARSFLHEKIRTAWIHLSILSMPPALGLAIAFPGHAGLLIGLVLLGMLYVTTMLLGKYAAYPSELNLPQGILIAMAIAFPPLLLALIPYFYFIAVRRLQILLP